MTALRKLRVAVSAMNNTDNPGPGIPVIRCLKESGRYDIEAVGLAYDSLEPGIYLPGMAEASYLMPYPLTGYRNMLERIREIHAERPLHLILPVLDSELVAYVRMQDELKDMGIATFLPTAANLEMRSKANLASFGFRTGVPIPYTRVVYNLTQLYSAVAEFVYPIVVKGVFYDAVICQTYDDAVAAFTKLARKWGVPVILQQFLKGDEYNIAAVGDGAGNTMGAVISRKMYITDKGKGWSGIAIRNDELLALARSVIGHLQWRGGLELEIIRGLDDRYYLLEINPRFPAWIYFSAGIGINLPEMVVALALNEPVEPKFDYPAGKMFLRYSTDVVIDMAQLEQITTSSRYANHG